MIESNQKTSLLIPSQLPAFVRDNPDYSNFVLFLQAYYEWMEQNGNVTDRSKNLLNYADIDKTTSEFIDYFTNEFLPYFPQDALIDKAKAVKLAREMYQSKGTPASYQFLFRGLYNSDVDIFYTKDAVLRASDGIWYVAKSLRLASNDPNFLGIANYRLFGETSKSLATVETAVYNGNKIEVFISDIERLFQSGEFIRVIDSNNQDVLFNGQPLRAKIVGQISQIKINPNFRGQLYQPGDPVIVYGGLNAANGIGATATVGTTTKGSIQRINVLTGGYGYTNYPNTTIDITNAGGATAIVGSLDPDVQKVANVALIPMDTITLKRYISIGAANYFFSNIAVSNANTTLAEAFSFESFTTYPISSVLVTNGGGGITKVPQVSAISSYPNDAFETPNLKSLGILAPIQITSGGEGYVANDTIVFTGGSGYGAYANVTEVAANGQIIRIEYVSGDGTYALGGMGYRADGLPIVEVNSSNVSASGASIYVPGILGDGATFSSVTDRAGSISTINISNYGEDYIATPNVSIKVEDVLVTGVDIVNLPQKEDIIYQGASVNISSYSASVNSISLLVPNANTEQSVYVLRVYNYSSVPDKTLTLKVEGKDINLSMAGYAYDSNYDANGVRIYGDGTAKATATFLNGLTISQGQYLNTRGQPSSFDKLEDGNYNNYTYILTVSKEIEKYRDILLNLLHPTGMKVLGRYSLTANSTFDYRATSSLEKGHTLGYFTGNPGSYGTMVTDWDNKSNNIINFYGLSGANLQQIIAPGDIVTLTTADGFQVDSQVLSVNIDGANNIILTDNTWLTFANVAYVTANAGSDEINITSLTGSYNIINNGIYSNTAYPLKDIVYAGDKVLVANNTERTVQSVNYVDGIITLTSALTNATNSLMSVNRTVSTSDVRINGIEGVVFSPELLTQDGRILTTQDGKILIIG